MQRFSKQQRLVLCNLADPERAVDDIDPLSVFSLDDLISVAEMHGISSIIHRKLKEYNAQNAAGLEMEISAGNETLRFQTAAMLDLDFHGKKIGQALSNSNIEHRYVKGLTFANDLYDNPNDRPYTDIDIVVPLEQLAQATKIAIDLNYTQSIKAELDGSERNQEIKLLWPGARHILIELHGNLVHMQKLRQVKKIGFPELSMAYDRQTPFVGHFIIAVAHASLGHKFHNLKLMVDCLQAMRRLNEEDLPYLAQMVSQFNLRYEVATCLGLCQSIFGGKEIAAKAALMKRELSLPFASPFVRAADVLQAPLEKNAVSRLRRYFFRLSQMV